MFNARLSSSELWEAINRRIDQEERASLFLGARNDVGSQTSAHMSWREFVMGSFSSYRAGGVAGAIAVCTVLAVGISAFYDSPILFQGSEKLASRSPALASSESRVSLPTNEPLSITPFGQGANETSAPIEFVSSRGMGANSSSELDLPLTSMTFDRFSFDALYAGNGMRDPQYSLERPTQREPQMLVSNVPYGHQEVQQSRSGPRKPPVEVDWMRSDGRVRILNGPRALAPVILVKRRAPLTQGSNQSQPPITNSSGIVLQERNIPSTTFANR
jgi:hypothetical protein